MVTKILNTWLTRGLIHPLVFARGGLRYSRFRRQFADFAQRPPADQDRFRLERLNDLLARVRAGNPFYRGFHADGPPLPLASLAEFAALPCLTKEHLRQDLVLSADSPRPRGTTRVQTAGTTGLPVTVYKTRATHAAQIARRKLCFAGIGVEYGAREARFWGRRIDRQGFSLRDLLLNRRTFGFLGSEAANLREAAALRRFAPDYFYGYSTMILAAADLWERHGLPPLPLQGVVCTAESLGESQRARIAGIFGCPVFMEYGCSELDLIALQCGHGNYHVAGHHVVLEVEPPGAAAGEAVVTDLTNALQPLIRYRLGDRLTLAAGPCACGRPGPAIAAIAGRTLTQLIRLADGRTVHAVVFAHLFEALSDGGQPIHRFKVWQEEPNGFLVRLELSGPADQEALAELIRREIAAALGPEVTVRVKVEPIPATPGEKFTYFVPLADERQRS